MYELEFQPERFEAYAEAEDFEAFDTELADEEWEDEFRRFGRMPGRAPRPRPRMRSAPRRRPSQRPPGPPKRLIQRPQRPPRRPPRPTRRAGWPTDSIQQPDNAEPEERGSEYVRWVQISLNQILGLRLPITGVMNAAARSALRTFQGQQNLPTDGIAGPETRKALIEAKAKPSGRGDEPSPSGKSKEPSQSGPGEEPAPSAPSEEPPSSGPNQEPSTQEPSQPGEFEWLGVGELQPLEVESESGHMRGIGRWVRRGNTIIVLLDNRATRSDYEFDEIPLVAKKGAAAAVAAQAQKVAVYARAAVSAEKTCWVQTVLIKAESESINADGIQGPLTREAIRRFQARNSLSVDGIVGPRTEMALIQTALNSLAQASILPVNGVVDARTRQEIKRFQSRQKLGSDGIVGPRTRGAMVVALGGRCVGSTPSSATKLAKPAQWVQTKSSCDKTDYARRVNQCIEDSKKCFIAAHEDLALAAAACLAAPGLPIGKTVCGAAATGRYLLALRRCRDAILPCDEAAKRATGCL